MYTPTTNKRKHWDPILAAVSVLNMYVVHDLNGLNAYTSCTMLEQDSVVVRHENTNYMRAINTAHKTSYLHWLHVTCQFLTKFLEQLY